MTGRWLPVGESNDPDQPGILWHYFKDGFEDHDNGWEEYTLTEVKPYPKGYFD